MKFNRNIISLQVVAPKPTTHFVLKDPKHGPGNRPYWQQAGTRFPALIKFLQNEPDPDRRRAVIDERIRVLRRVSE